MIRFSLFQFHPVIVLPKDYEVYDFSRDYDAERKTTSPFGIGKYNEKRKNMYTADLFQNTRDIHVGIDIGATAGTEVHVFFPGEIFMTGNNDRPGDYGYTVITKHSIDSQILFALYGHLSKESVTNNFAGKPLTQGEVFAWVGKKTENGGWNPHLHFQLCLVEPDKCDLPGVVSEQDRAHALTIYPDPQLVLGKLYD